MNNPIRSIGIIPARGGSKGVPRKNIRPVAGRPLLAYTVDAARYSRSLAHCVVSTDDGEIAEVARSEKCDVIMRPAELAADNAPTVPVLIHALDVLKQAGQVYDYLVLLQPTSPLRTAQDIDDCLQLLIESKADSVVSVAEVPGHYHPDWQFTVTEGVLGLYNGQSIDRLIPRRQLLSASYTRNGAIYAVRVPYLLERHTLLSPSTRAYIMPEARSINIDSELDLKLAELLIQSALQRQG